MEHFLSTLVAVLLGCIIFWAFRDKWGTMFRVLAIGITSIGGLVGLFVIWVFWTEGSLGVIAAWFLVNVILLLALGAVQTLARGKIWAETGVVDEVIGGSIPVLALLVFGGGFLYLVIYLGSEGLLRILGATVPKEHLPTIGYWFWKIGRLVTLGQVSDVVTLGRIGAGIVAGVIVLCAVGVIAWIGEIRRERVWRRSREKEEEEAGRQAAKPTEFGIFDDEEDEG